MKIVTLPELRTYLEAQPEDRVYFTSDKCKCPVAMYYLDVEGMEVEVFSNSIDNGDMKLIPHTPEVKMFISYVDTYSGSITAQECMMALKWVEDQYAK